MEYEIVTRSDGYVVKEKGNPEVISKAVCIIKGVDKELAEYLALVLSTWDEDREFYRELKEIPFPEPTELEKIQMQANLYQKRLGHLKVFIEKTPDSHYLIDMACRQVLTSIHGSRDRAIQSWMRDSTYPSEIKRSTKQ